MPRKASTFRVGDVRRAIAATRAEGLAIRSVNVTKSGEIKIEVAKPGEPESENDLDKWMAKRHAN